MFAHLVERSANQLFVSIESMQVHPLIIPQSLLISEVMGEEMCHRLLSSLCKESKDHNLFNPFSQAYPPSKAYFE
jgi:hypothetical protein